jgi:hypothetical protein
MRCPLVIGMNPSPAFPLSQWDERANSTAVLAEFATGDKEATWLLDEAFELVNLNDEIPPEATQRMFVDPEIAVQKLNAWSSEHLFYDRKVVLWAMRLLKSSFPGRGAGPFPTMV